MLRIRQNGNGSSSDTFDSDASLVDLRVDTVV